MDPSWRTLFCFEESFFCFLTFSDNVLCNYLFTVLCIVFFFPNCVSQRAEVLKYLFIYFYLHLRTYSLILGSREGRGMERERNMDAREKYPSVASRKRPDSKLNPQPRPVLWPGIKPVTSGLRDDTPTNWVILARAEVLNFSEIWFISFSYDFWGGSYMRNPCLIWKWQVFS